MSDLTSAICISGGIFAIMVITQFGTRAYSAHKVLMPLIIVAGFGYTYLHNAPTDSHAFAMYAVAAGIGLLFAAAAVVSTGVVVTADGGAATRCGIAFVAVWLVAVLARIAFVWLVEHDHAFRNWFGRVMMSHHLPLDAIAPFFMIWALTMVVARVAVIAIRVRRIPRDAIAVRRPAPAAM